MEVARVMPTRSRLALVLCVAGFVACEPPNQPAAVETVDSAGVAIATVHGAAVNLRTLVTEPLLSLGVADDPPEEAFGFVAGAVLLADGGVAVADAFDLRIAVFDSVGEHVRSFGRRGSGPGEFEAIAAVGRYRGDSLYVGEFGARRITVLDPSSGEGRVLRPGASLPGVPEAAADASCCHLLGATGQGAFLLAGPEWSPADGLEPRWGTVVVGLVPAEGGDPRVLAELRGAEHRASPSDYPRPSTTLHFGNELTVTSAGNGFVVSDGRSYSLRVFDADGGLTAITRVVRARLPVTESDRRGVQAYYDSLAARAGGSLEGSGLDWVANRPFADSIPAYAVLLEDRAGRLWAGFPTTGERVSEMVFDVFDSGGRYQWSVEIPPGLALLDAHGDAVLLRQVDGLGVQRVLLYRLASARH